MPNTFINLLPKTQIAVNNFAVANSTNGNLSIALALANGGAYGNAFTDNSVSNPPGSYFYEGFLPSDFTMPIGAQLRSLQIICNAEYNAPGQIPQIQHALYPQLRGQIPNLSSAAYLYASNPPGGGQAGSANSPIWNLQGSGITAAQWNSFSQLNWQFTTSGPAAQVSVYSVCQLSVGYNQAAVATVNIGGTTGTFTIATMTPTVSWTYADPEGDPQERFIVNVYAGVGNGSSASPIWSSGEQFSSATSYAIPLGVLKNYQSTTIEVVVADLGSNGRYTPYGNAASVMVVTPQIDPMLQPSFTPQFTNPLAATTFNASSGAIGPLVVKARPNLFSIVNAAFESGTSPGLGRWTAITGTLSTNTANPMRGVGCAAVTATAGGAFNVNSGSMSAGSGIVYTALLHMRPLSAGTKNIPFNMVFVDSSGTTVIGSATTTVCHPGSGVSVSYVKGFVQALAPPGTTFIYLNVSMTGLAASEVICFDCAAITPSMLNLIDNSSFEQGLNFWTSTGTVSTANDSTTTDSDNGIATGSYAAEFGSAGATIAANGNAAGGGNLLIGIHGAKFVLSGSAKPTLGTAPTFNLKLFGSVTYPAVTTYPLAAGAPWVRKVATFDATAMAAADYVSPIVQMTGTGTMRVDDISLEQIWSKTNLGFETGTGGATVPVINTLGTNILGWQNTTPYGHLANTKPTWDNAVFAADGGAQSLQLSNSPYDGSLPASVSQVITIGAGYTIMNLGWYWRHTNAYNTSPGALFNPGVTVNFYDAGGKLLVGSFNQTSYGLGTTFAWTQVASSPSAVPIGTAYCKIVLQGAFSNDGIAQGQVWFDGLSISFSGSTTTAATPYLDGGWSVGSPGDGFHAPGPIYVGLQRSYDEGVTWPSTVRIPANSALIALQVNSPDYEGTFTDYEYAPSLTGGSSPHFYYSGITEYSTVSQYSYAGGLFFSPRSPVRYCPLNNWNDWWLIDPLLPTDNVLLQVVKDTFKASTTEQMQTFDGVGRSRRVVIGDVVQGDVIDLTLQTMSNQQFALLQTQINKQVPLLLRSPDGEQWFVRTTKRDRTRKWLGTYTSNAMRTFTIQFQEVDPIL